jgi:hypothetical protein
MPTVPNIFESARVASPRCSVSRCSHSATFTPNHAASDSHDALLASPRISATNAFCDRALSANVSPKFVCAMLCALAAIVSGCAANQKPRARAFPWASANNVRPVAPKNSSSDVSNEDLFADLGLDVPAPPSPVAGLPSGPQRPRVAVVSTGNNNASHVPEAPMIAPQLSPEQTAQAQQQLSVSVGIAEKNIAASQGHSLNAMQSDLASKVRSFLEEAREAARVSDWTRASSAAKKAEVLSQELAGSL